MTSTSVLRDAQPKKERARSWKEVATRFGDDFVRKATLSRAASLSYYTTLAIAPFTVITLICFSLLGQDMIDDYTRQIGHFLGREVSGVFEIAIASSKSRPDLGTAAGVLSVLTLLLSAGAVFSELRYSLDAIHGFEPVEAEELTWMQTIREFIWSKVLNAGLVLGFIFLLVTSLLLSSIVSFFSVFVGESLAFLVDWIGSGFAYALTFAFLFRYIPSRRLSWRDAGRGGVITALFFLIGKQLISTYLSSSTIATSYGAAGTLVIFLLWVYYSATILFACAELNEVLAAPEGEARPAQKSRWRVLRPASEGAR